LLHGGPEVRQFKDNGWLIGWFCRGGGVPRLPSKSGRSAHGEARMELGGFWAIGGLGFVNGYPDMTGRRASHRS